MNNKSKTIASWIIPIMVRCYYSRFTGAGRLVHEGMVFAGYILSTIMGFIMQPLPIGAIALISITITQLANVLKPSQALAGFGNSSIWLIVAAFLFAKSFIKRGSVAVLRFG